MSQEQQKYDVLVLGGGIAGSMAAIAASRAGAETLLIEQNGFLGGMLTAAGVGPMMTFHAGQQQVVQGLTGELIERMKAVGASPGHLFDTTGYTYTVTPFDADRMKTVLEQMLIEAGGTVLYHTMFVDADCEEGQISSIRVCNKAGLSSFQAGVFVDASGDADLAFQAGVPCRQGREKDRLCQPMSMIFKASGVDTGKVREYIRGHVDEFPSLKGDASLIDEKNSPRLSIGGFTRSFKQAQQEGRISFDREMFLFFETNNPGEVIVNTSRVQGYDPTDPFELSRAEAEGRRQVQELQVFMKTLPGFEQAQTVSVGGCIGVRSSRQIIGNYTLTREDVETFACPAHSVAFCGYPIDIHSPKAGGDEGAFRLDHFKQGSFYGIPYECLVQSSVRNLIVAGRCISATFEAQAGIRTTPTLGAVGHAAGAAAALAALDRCSVDAVDYAKLKAILQEQGAFFPGDSQT